MQHLLATLTAAAAFAASALAADPSSTTSSAAAASTPLTCASGLYIIVARGTGEAQGPGLTGILADEVVKQIPGSVVAPVVYPAVFSIYWDSEGTGAKHTKQMVLDYHKQCPTGKIALMGWSQGGQAIVDVICGGAKGLFDHIQAADMNTDNSEYIPFLPYHIMSWSVA